MHMVYTTIAKDSVEKKVKSNSVLSLEPTCGLYTEQLYTKNIQAIVSNTTIDCTDYPYTIERL